MDVRLRAPRPDGTTFAQNLLIEPGSELIVQLGQNAVRLGTIKSYSVSHGNLDVVMEPLPGFTLKLYLDKIKPNMSGWLIIPPADESEKTVFGDPNNN